MYAGETPESELRLLPPATQLEPHVPTLSSSLLNLTQSFIGTPGRRRPSSLDDSVLDESQSYLDATQLDESQVSLDESDEELVDLLVDLMETKDGGEDKPTTVADGVSVFPPDGESPCDPNGGESSRNKATPSQEKREVPTPSRVRRRESDEDMFASVSGEEKDQPLPTQGCILASPIRTQFSQNRYINSPCTSQNSDSYLPKVSQTGEIYYSPKLSQRSNKKSQNSDKRSERSREEIEDMFSQSLCLSEIDEFPEDIDEDQETLEMSQVIWDTDPFQDSQSKSDSQESNISVGSNPDNFHDPFSNLNGSPDPFLGANHDLDDDELLRSFNDK